MAILRKISRLASEFSVAARGVDAFQLKSIYASLPALYEWLFDEAPPGSGAQLIRGEDHSGPFNDGGVGIPRNCIASVGYGNGLDLMWETLIANLGGWTNADIGYSPERSQQLGYHVRAYVDPELDSLVHPALFIEGWLFSTGDFPVIADLQARLFNASMGAASTSTVVAVIPSEITCIHIKEIPVIPAFPNDFLIQYQTTEEGYNVKTFGLILSEVYKAGAESTASYVTPLSQPPIIGAVP